MLFDAKDQPVGDADIERAAWLAGEHVDPELRPPALGAATMDA
jgi:hypothetical protein